MKVHFGWSSPRLEFEGVSFFIYLFLQSGSLWRVYRLFVRSRRAGEFWRALTLNSCDIRTSLFWLLEI